MKESKKFKRCLKFFRKVVERANANSALMDGTTGSVREIIDSADVVYGIWQDETGPHGIGWLVIKGKNRMREVAADNKAKRLSWNAIVCVAAEQAEAARQIFGEADHLQ